MCAFLLLVDFESESFTLNNQYLWKNLAFLLNTEIAVLNYCSSFDNWCTNSVKVDLALLSGRF